MGAGATDLNPETDAPHQIRGEGKHWHRTHQAAPRSISIFLLIVRLLWGLIVTGLFALLGGFFGNNPPHNPVLIGKALLSVWWMFLGPLSLIFGAVCTLRGVYPQPGAIAALAGCLMLAGTMVYQIAQVLHDADPLVARSYGLYVLYAIAAVLALLADVGAVKLYRLVVMANRTPL
jgi:hypothetical protein